jgi:hypothetical protein
MTTSTEQIPGDTIEEGQILPQHKRLQEQQQRLRTDHPLNPTQHFSLMDAQSNPNNASAVNRNVAQTGNPSSELHNDGPVASTSDMTTSEAKTSLSDITLLATTGESSAQSALNSTAPTHLQDTSVLPRRTGPRSDFRPEKEGYERKIGRGTSWRRDHETLVEEDYALRGRGRGSGSGAPSRGGRGNYYRDQDARGYYRRDFDRQSPMDQREAYPPDPYYDSRGAYPPPIYDTRRDYPPESRYFDDYRRYDPRDVPPPSHLPPAPLPPVDSRRPYDRGPPGRDDPSDYGRPYSRPRDPRDDFRGDPRLPRDADPRYPPESRALRDPRVDPRDDPRFIDEGITSRD